MIRRIHHVAYRCHDMAETVAFYRDLLDMEFTMAFAEDRVPSTKETDPYMHAFLDAGNGNVLAFFELPTRPKMGRDPNTPAWVQHIAFEVDSMDELHAARTRLERAGIEVLGPTDHGVFQSIYFFDPNGHRVELAVNTGTPEQLARARAVAPAMLEEWSRTRRAPRHAAWLHAGEFAAAEPAASAAPQPASPPTSASTPMPAPATTPASTPTPVPMSAPAPVSSAGRDGNR